MGQALPVAASAIDLPAGFDAYCDGKFGSICAAGGKAVAVPKYSEKILVVDPATLTASAIDLPAGFYAGLHKFSSICAVGAKAVAAPDCSEKILVVDPATLTASAIDLPAGFITGGYPNVSSICAVGAKAVAAPAYSEKILVVDPATLTASAIDLPAGFITGGYPKFSSICAVGAKAVAAPENSEKILVVDPATLTVSAIDLPAGFCAGRPYKFSSICAVGAKAVAAPENSEKILVVDPATLTVSAIDLPAGFYAGLHKFSSICAVGAKAVAAPAFSEKILVVDPATLTASAIDLPAGFCAGRPYKFSSICAVGAKAVAAPENSEKILVVDPATLTVSAIDLPAGFYAGLHKFSSICAVGAKAVAAPAFSEKILVVDPATLTASAIDLPAGFCAGRPYKFSSICAVGAKAVAAPENSEKFLVVDLGTAETDLGLSLDGSDVFHRNEFADLVAAVLSSWIYTDALEPPHVEGVFFEVHRIIQPGTVGTVAKIAAVTATLPEPTGKVLYMVFKGTSYILDYLNWQLEHDNSTTRDRSFFVHKGAAGTVAQMQFMKSQQFMDRLESAISQGVRKLVWTGHSLGGMYAQVSLFSAWKMLNSRFSSPDMDVQSTLRTFQMKCVTFGSPMVFGGASEQAMNFRAFARERAVNYINGNDPCPRAWGALNLREFIKQATKGVMKGVTDSYGCVAGYIASGFVPQLAENLMNRPDFGQIEDLARRYDHFVPLKVLSTKREFCRWKEFSLTPECLQDHDVDLYVKRLFDSWGPSRPVCYIHHQDQWISECFTMINIEMWRGKKECS